MKRPLTTALTLAFPLILACSRAALKHPVTDIGNSVPAAIVVERVLPTMMLDQDLRQPIGLACDSDGTIYVVDHGNDRVIKLTTDLLPVRDVGGRGPDLGLFDGPMYVTFDEGRGIVVSDSENRRLERFTSRLEASDQIKIDDPDDPLKFGQPSGVALTDDGSYRIADLLRNRLIELDNVGMFKKFLGDLGDRGGQLDAPQKVLVDKQQNVYVCDAGNARVVVYDKFDNLLRIISHDALSYPVAAVFDRTGNLWVIDQPTAQIFCFTHTGELLTDKPIQILGATPPFDKPSDMALLSDGRLLISDSGNNRLVVCNVIRNP
ncbi:hypothetical protein C3F09_09955 [candidate division GN15 bacterium]|uniref:SMP-30/Gluconolactonase/LRE-like region domain-containing protein n=1 Tax=candidate division GN15 bacterium TaxID=2072418 RepID=A0A855X3G2_9BACT|nr:MAG: hypothetical protein C3F09_09955 [candidate division GN15 bacterium]